MIERVLAVVAANGEEAGRGEALIERVGEGIADPAKVGLAGAVVEGEDQYQAAAGLANVGGGVGAATALGVGIDSGPGRYLGLKTGG